MPKSSVSVESTGDEGPLTTIEDLAISLERASLTSDLNAAGENSEESAVRSSGIESQSRRDEPQIEVPDWEEEDGDIGYSVPAPRKSAPTVPEEGTEPVVVSDMKETARTENKFLPLNHATGKGPTVGHSSSDSLSQPGPSRQHSISSTRSLTPSKSPAAEQIPLPYSPSLSSPVNTSNPSPQPRYMPFKSPIPKSVPLFPPDSSETDIQDNDAPFESIPLQTTPPPLPTSATLPSSPTLHPGSPDSRNKEKRRSWTGFGLGNGNRQASISNGSINGHSGGSTSRNASRSSVSVLPENHVSKHTSSNASASGSSTPARRHAPPAHPHPFPIPTVTSQPPPSSKRHSMADPSSSKSPVTPTHVGLGAKGISTFEKVISHTRPSWLPPKDKTEDETHYHQWEEMMAKARETERERRKVEEARRVEKERRLAIATPIWEDMLNDKDFSVAKVRNNPKWRQVWFEGAPTYLRGKAWSMAIGNPLAMSKDAYKAYVTRARRALDSGRFPQPILDQMEKDFDETLVNLHLFQKGSPLRSDLKELLCAWVVYRSDDAMGYAPYVNLLGAMFLLTLPPAAAFNSLVNLLSRPILRAFYTETQDEIDAFYRVFENLQADNFPMIFANCKNLGLKVPESWFRSVLVEQVPFEAACRLWDQIVLDGDGYIFRAALAIFGFLEPRLYFPDRDEILSILEGRNRATLAITERERDRAKLRGETYNEGLDGKMSVFGLTEHALFEWIEKDDWKESRFERLVVREMPD